MKKQYFLVFLFSIILIFSLTSCQNKSNTTPTDNNIQENTDNKNDDSSSKEDSKRIEELEENNWVPETRNAINNLMQNYGKHSDGYDDIQKPYVVFDFDNTTAFFDVQEALLIYQLENLRFKIPKDKMYDVLITEIPNTNFTEEYNNIDNKTLNIEMVARDCQNAYEWIFDNYEEFEQGGTMTIDEIHKTDQYKEFTTKVRYLYDAIGGTFDASVCYPWVTYLFTGMTSEEVRKLAEDSHDYWFTIDKWEKIKWESPDIESESGRVTTSYKTSIAIPPESKDLYKKLMTNGFDVYICSASFIDVIEPLAYNPKYGLNVPEGNVYAMMLKKDENDRYINEYDYDTYFQTQGPGKRKTIDKFILPKYNGKGPIMVCGDSQGDFNMITEYNDETKLGLIINRVRSDDFKFISREASETFGKPNAKYVLQGRDENKGVYIKTQESILLGETEPKLLSE